jgi:hypothetical protein
VSLLAWLVGIGAFVLAAQWVAAFRGRPPFLAFIPDVGPVLMTLWFARSLLLCAVIGGLLTARAAHLGVVGPSAVWLLFAVAVCGWWGRSTLRSAANEHRV